MSGILTITHTQKKVLMWLQTNQETIQGQHAQ